MVHKNIARLIRRHRNKSITRLVVKPLYAARHDGRRRRSAGAVTRAGIGARAGARASASVRASSSIHDIGERWHFIILYTVQLSLNP